MTQLNNEPVFTKPKYDLFLEWISIVGPIVACVIFLHGEIKGIDTKLERYAATQSARSDKLYEMFISLVKEGRAQ